MDRFYERISTGSFFIGTIILLISLVFVCCAHRAKPFTPDRSNPQNTIKTLAWAMENNNATEIMACFLPQSRFLEKLGGAEGLNKAAEKYPPQIFDLIYWQNLTVLSIKSIDEKTALLNAISSYEGELIRVVLVQVDGSWVIQNADSYPLPVEARFPTSAALEEAK